jgi:tetratricopeptide (TPR) repeat protein
VSAEPIVWAAAPSGGQGRTAIALARAACAQMPDHPGPRRALAAALERTGAAPEAADLLRRAAADFPDDERVAAELGALLARTDAVDEGLALAARWRARPWAAPLALQLLTQSGREDDAADWEARAAASHPHDLNLFQRRSRRAMDDPERLLALCEARLARSPGDTHGLYRKAIALSRLGRGAEAAALMGLDAFVSIGALPGRFGDGGEFRARLRAEILANPSIHADPMANATRNGLRTRRFPVPGDSAAPHLVAAIQAAVSHYAARLTGDHPFVRGRPLKASLHAWALIFRAAGRQDIHIHPAGWMTGVYYVDAPPPAPDGGGRLRIGLLPDWAGAPPWPVREIDPVPGRLVLFPSFVPHDTVPTGCEDERIAVAFDVVPAAGRGLTAKAAAARHGAQAEETRT